MIYLLVVSLIWAFSFGLIKGTLVELDSNFVSSARLLISFLVFLPLLKIKFLNKKLFVKLLLIGAIQYGVMYACYIYAFQFLKAYEIVLFTIFTPIYIVVINHLFERKFYPFFYLTSLLALVGTAIIVWNKITSAELLVGFALMQASNIAFAYGQIHYKKIMEGDVLLKDKNIYAILFLGAFIFTFFLSLISTDYTIITITTKQVLTLLYLGAIASGLGFFLWNYGAKLVNTGSLAVYNNIKIPLGILVSLIFFSEETNIWNLLLGGLLVVFALLINEYQIKKNHN